jgi:hypothetical protein
VGRAYKAGGAAFGFLSDNPISSHLGQLLVVLTGLNVCASASRFRYFSTRHLTPHRASLHLHRKDHRSSNNGLPSVWPLQTEVARPPRSGSRVDNGRTPRPCCGRGRRGHNLEPCRRTARLGAASLGELTHWLLHKSVIRLTGPSRRLACVTVSPARAANNTALDGRYEGQDASD